MALTALQEKTSKNKELGEKGECLAAAWLKEHGFAIVERNVSFRGGEIDIIARRGTELHFVEVKSRRSLEPVPPLEAVTVKKMQRIRHASLMYLMKKGLQSTDIACYFDVVAVDFSVQPPSLEVVLDAFA
jgi:putative endonuclease